MYETRKVSVGRLVIGGHNPVWVQSMTNTDTRDVGKTLAQIRALHAAGCDLVRVSVYDVACAKAVRDLVDGSPCPLVADIHFDYKLAIAAAEGGAAKIRINPGNIGGEDRVQAVVEVCKSKHIPIRIGVNGGSLDKKLLEKYGHPTAEALVESAFSHLELLEKQGFYDTCVSMKSSTVPVMVAACRLFRQRCDYPLHIGVTETGPVRMGMIKSAMGIGALLLDGIGETVRVSLTADPVQEVYAAKEILRAAGLRKEGVNIISCPTCGRTCNHRRGGQVARVHRGADEPYPRSAAGGGDGLCGQRPRGGPGGGCGHCRWRRLAASLFVKGQTARRVDGDRGPGPHRRGPRHCGPAGKGKLNSTGKATQGRRREASSPSVAFLRRAYPSTKAGGIPMTQLRYAPAGRQGIPAIFAQAKAVIDAYEDVEHIPYDRVMDWTRRKIAGHLTEYRRIYRGEELAGYYRFAPAEGKMELDDLYSLPACRGQGTWKRGASGLPGRHGKAGIPVRVYAKCPRPGRCMSAWASGRYKR